MVFLHLVASVDMRELFELKKPSDGFVVAFLCCVVESSVAGFVYYIDELVFSRLLPRQS